MTYISPYKRAAKTWPPYYPTENNSVDQDNDLPNGDWERELPPGHIWVYGPKAYIRNITTEELEKENQELRKEILRLLRGQ